MDGDDHELLELSRTGHELRAQRRFAEAISILRKMLARQRDERRALSARVILDARLAIIAMLVDLCAYAEAEGMFELVAKTGLEDSDRFAFLLAHGINLGNCSLIAAMLDELHEAKRVAEADTSEDRWARSGQCWAAMVRLSMAKEEWDRLVTLAPAARAFAIEHGVTDLEELATFATQRAQTELALAVPDRPPWDVVFEQITTRAHAIAFTDLILHRGDQVLHANDVPIADLMTPGARTRTRPVVDRFVKLLDLDADTEWADLHCYRETYPEESPEEIHALVSRCRAAGVRLHHRSPRGR